MSKHAITRTRGASPAVRQARASAPAGRFGHVLVPLDFPANNARAPAIAGALAGEGAKVTLLHVVARIADDAKEVEAFHAGLVRAAATKMLPIAAKLKRGGFEVDAVVVVGDRIEEILKFAAASGVDLIVLRSHKVGPGSGWGTISYQVAILSRCPVFLVK